MTKMYDVEQLKEWGGIVDYVVGATPSPGVFVFATRDDPKQRHYLNLYKLGRSSTASTPRTICVILGTSVGRQSCHISRRGNGSIG